MKKCIPMTEYLLEKYTDFCSLEDYFGRYTLKEGYLDRIRLPLTLLTSGDDPIIPCREVASIGKSGQVRFISQPNGGHCGYLMNSRLESWYLPLMLRAFTF